MSRLKWKWNMKTPYKNVKHPLISLNILSNKKNNTSTKKKSLITVTRHVLTKDNQQTWWHGGHVRARVLGHQAAENPQGVRPRWSGSQQQITCPKCRSETIMASTSKAHTMESCFSYFETRSHIYFGYGKAFCWKKGPLKFLLLITTFQSVIRQWKSDMAQNPAQNSFVELVFCGKMLT